MDMTLEEMEQQDIQAVHRLLDESHNKVCFDVEVHPYMQQCLTAALTKCGVKSAEVLMKNVNESPMYAKLIDKRLSEAGVKVERRAYDRDDDSERSGIYVYKNYELAYFISFPTPSMIAGYWNVRSNISP